MDCVRADDFPGGRNPVEGLRFVESLRGESVVFPRAVSPAPWTIPSHASLFTGLYPWEHGVNMGGAVRLSESVPTLPTLLRERGYGTIALSANGFIGPEMGLTQTFDAAAWGDWWERYVRLPNRSIPPRATNLGPTQRLPNGPQWHQLESKAWYFHRLPILIDAANRLMQQVRFPHDAQRLAVSPWIEATLGRWLAVQPPDRPVFAFVNLLEAHEPYLTDPDLVHGFANWFRTANVRMDKTSVLAGAWTPSARERERLHRLYRDMVRFIDRRIAGLVAALRDARRWENTLLVLTSDHGQAFGEHGCLFHGQRLWEPLVRVPMWMRAPHGEGGGATGQGWSSLIDVAPTVAARAGLSASAFRDAVALDELVDRPRPTPVFTMADGIHQKMHVKKFAAAAQMEQWERFYVGAYEGDTKLVLDLADQSVRAYDVARDPGEEHDIWSTTADRFGGIVEQMRRIGEQLKGGATGATSPEVEDRLRSWGYL